MSLFRRIALRVPPLVLLLAGLAILFVVGVTIHDAMRRHPEHLPWTPLSLAAPIGHFTGAKMARLTEDAPKCRQLLREAGAEFAAAPPIAAGQCGYTDGVYVVPNALLATGFQPAKLIVACPVAAAMLVWEREIVRPAALRHFGTPIESIEHLGSYNCRRIAGSPNWSEHATADAIDIAGFRLPDGRRIDILEDWQGKPADAAFLRDVRDGACGVFATVLSPDYNAAHADHLHLDQATRGRAGRGFCG
jgi:hypothetical protein